MKVNGENIRKLKHENSRIDSRDEHCSLVDRPESKRPEISTNERRLLFFNSIIGSYGRTDINAINSIEIAEKSMLVVTVMERVCELSRNVPKIVRSEFVVSSWGTR